VARLVLCAAVALTLGGCGYGFSHRYVARGGAEQVHVAPFENLSTEPALGAALASALRTELARRGADGGAGAPATIVGEVRAVEAAPTSLPVAGAGGPGAAQARGGTWKVGLAVRARLVAGGAVVAEHAVRRDADYVGGADPLESEGRRAIALRRLADEAAREILRAFEAG
jgi:hypothetical protein